MGRNSWVLKVVEYNALPPLPLTSFYVYIHKEYHQKIDQEICAKRQHGYFIWQVPACAKSSVLDGVYPRAYSRVTLNQYVTSPCFQLAFTARM